VVLLSPRLVIVADDLTGALDAAGPFALRGLRVQVALHPGAFAAALQEGADIVSVSTASRELPAVEAQAAVRRVLAAVPDGVEVFKKIDSRLKGNLVTELSCFDFRRALVIPAIPAFDRNVRNGAVVGFGVDVPIDVASCLGDLAGRCSVPDVTGDDEIDHAIAAEKDADLYVGARGLAEALARKMAGAEKRPVAFEPLSHLTFIAGSRDPITEAQVADLRDHGDGAAYIPAIDGVIDAAGREMLADQADGAIDRSPRLRVIHSLASGAALVSALDAVSDLARDFADLGGAQSGALFLTGGATAEAVLGALKIEQLALLGEVLEGMPLARCGDLLIMTKSGGFGAPDALCRIAVKMLEGEEQ
jgi:uncharacterized protein YgbK (DUF1537 family)